MAPRNAFGRVAALVVVATVGFSMPATTQEATATPTLGRPPTLEEIASWDLLVAPDGSGLPAGQGNAVEGKKVYERECLRCHGPGATGAQHEALVGGTGSLASDEPVRTVISYWPYATTLWDYTYRAMPFDRPGTLSTDQVYAVVAYILSLGKLLGEDEIIDRDSLPRVVMPNRDGFVPDPRPDVAGPQASGDG